MVASVNRRNVNVFVCHGLGSIGGEAPDVLRSGPLGSTPSRTGLVGSGLAATAVLGCAFLGLDVLRFLLDPKVLVSFSRPSAAADATLAPGLARTPNSAWLWVPVSSQGTSARVAKQRSPPCA